MLILKTLDRNMHLMLLHSFWYVHLIRDNLRSNFAHEVSVHQQVVVID